MNSTCRCRSLLRAQTFERFGGQNSVSVAVVFDFWVATVAGVIAAAK